MTKLTKQSLEEALSEIQKLVEARNDKTTLMPTKLFYQPAAIAAMGLTHDDVLRILNGNITEEDEKKINAI